MNESHMEEQRVLPKVERIMKLLAVHPYLMALLVCLLVNPFFLGAINNIPNNALWLEEFFVFGIGMVFLMYSYQHKKIMKRTAFLAGLLFFVLDVVLLKFYAKSEYKVVWLFVGGCLLTVGMISCIDKAKYERQKISLLIMGVGFFQRLSYILGTSVYTRQHDIGYFDAGAQGHTGYIEYLYVNHALPDFDVRTRWQFAHPPLHHTISAIWIYISDDLLKIGHDPARESIQTLTLFYSICILISAYKIMRYFKLEGKALYIPLALVAFHPTFSILAGSINNDILSAAFFVGAILCSLRWYEQQSMKNILKIALCVGLGMMSKMSAAVVAPPIALLFLFVFVKKIKTDGKRLFGQFCCFGLVCVPLGLGFEIKNYIKWNLPLTFVHPMSADNPQYVGDTGLLQRLTDFSKEHFQNIYVGFAPDHSNESNPIISILKCSVFGEWDYHEKLHATFIPGLLLWFGAALAIGAFIAMLVVCVRRSKAFIVEKWFVFAIYVTMMFAYFKMQVDYPFVCTTDFRYISPTVIIGALYLGMLVQKWTKRDRAVDGVAVNFVEYVAGAFVILSIIFILILSQIG